MWWRPIISTCLVLGTVVALLPHLLWLITYLCSRLLLLLPESWRGGWHGQIPYAPFGWTALVLMLVVWLCIGYGYFFGRFQTVVNQVSYVSSRVPKSFDGYRIAHISDLHVDSFERLEDLQRVMTLVNEQQADVIVFTGDMSTHRKQDILRHTQSLRSLTAKDGVVSVLGNHDFFIYDRHNHSVEDYCKGADTLTAYERNVLGWTVLRNQSILIHRDGDSIAIAGVDNITGDQGFRTIQMGDLGKAMAGLDDVFTVLLSHDPGHWRAEVLPKSHAEITLSGHTHAAQMRLFGWTLAHLSFRECDGRYDEQDRMLYVNAGIGCTALFRIGCPSEITVITLHSK